MKRSTRTHWLRTLMIPAAILGLIVGASTASSAPSPDEGDWNSWRGPNRDGRSPDTGLLKSWPSGGPKLAWKTSGIGHGYSSASVWRDRIYTMGDSGSNAYLYCLRANDGGEVWKTRINAARTHRQYPGPRSTPATDGDVVVAMGETGELVCVEAKTGKERWKKHMERDFGGQMMSRWKWSESPLIDDDLVLVTPCGSGGAVVALSKEDGSQVWRSTSINSDRAGYTSLVPIEIDGTRQYMVLTDRTIAGVDAKSGKALWSAKRLGSTAVAASPIYADGYVFTTSGYRVGCNGFQVSGKGGSYTAKEIYRGRQMANHHGGCVEIDGYVYGVDDSGAIKCLDIKTGKEKWASPRVGKGSVAYADGHIVYRAENQKRGTTILFEATPSAYKEKGRFDPPNTSGPKWAHPTISGGKLYLRDNDLLLCYDLAEGSGGSSGSSSGKKPRGKAY